MEGARDTFKKKNKFKYLRIDGYSSLDPMAQNSIIKLI